MAIFNTSESLWFVQADTMHANAYNLTYEFLAQKINNPMYIITVNNIQMELIKVKPIMEWPSLPEGPSYNVF